MTGGDSTGEPRQPSSEWVGAPPSEICIVMLSALGDSVHVLPVANALKRTWPDARITWVVQPLTGTLMQGHPSIDELVIFQRRRGLGLWRSYRELRRAVGHRRFDLLLGLQVYLKAGLITALTRADVKLGFDARRARDGQWLFTNRRIPPHEPQHVQDQYFEFLEYLGVDPEPVTWGIRLSDWERGQQEAFFDRLDRPACAVVLAATAPERNWNAEGYARVLDELDFKHGLRPVIVGGPSELERRMAYEVIERSSAEIVDALGDDVRKLVWLLDASALVISPDTGPLHIARALGKPTISLFGYTNPKRVGPYRAFQDLIVDGYAQFPGEEYPAARVHRDGMKRVTVDRVLEKVELAMREYVRP